MSEPLPLGRPIVASTAIHGAPTSSGIDAAGLRSENATLAASGSDTSSDGKPINKNLIAPSYNHEKESSASSSMDNLGELGGRDHHSVNVARGKAEFAALERKFSNMSQNSARLRRQQTNQSAISRRFSRTTDVESTAQASAVNGEKGDVDDKVEFNLLENIRASRDRDDEAGIKHKEVGVIWEDLEVVGAGGVKINIRTFVNAIVEQILAPILFILGLFGYKPFASKPRTILQPQSGVLRPGEMCLVLGRPNSGCSTFLKAITNQRDSYLSVNGNVEYAGVGFKEMKKLYAGETVYNQEDDVHLPTLTVAQTIRFALSTKTPANLPDGVTKKQFREEVLHVMLSMLNIRHTENTLVGNEYVRGVSGGERKRVSIAEMFSTRAAVCAWDNATRGLDASSGADWARSVRILTDITRMTTFSSLYQAGNQISDQFDKIMLLSEGRCLYFGPAKEARAYFVGLGYRDMPRQTTADYLSGCTDVNERQFADGRDENNVPSTPEALAEAYKNSDICRKQTEERIAYQKEMAEDSGTQKEFRQAVRDSKRKGVGKKSPYTVSFFTQIQALVVRQFQLKFQDKFQLYTSLGTSLVIALITGSVFYQLPTTASGAFTRGGVLFIGLLFNALTSFSELPAQMQGRASSLKQATNYLMFRPGALALAQTIADFPFNAVNILLFVIVLYFMAGLVYEAGAFFITYLFILLGFQVMSAFFRVLGTSTTSYDVAARLASVLISAMVTYAGYMIPVFAMKRWLFWIYYLNPLSYAYEAIFANEFSRIELTCDASYTVPHNVGSITSFPNNVGPNQLCSLPGSGVGQNTVSGTAYMRAGFNFEKSHIWRNFGILIGFFIFFLVLQVLSMEYLQKGANALAVVVFKKEDKDTKERNERLQERKVAFKAGELEADLSEMATSSQPFTWENLNYTVPVPGGERQLLNNVFGYVKPGSLTALMGASGAGKTTLLDVLAGRKSVGVISGDVLISGRPVGVDFQRSTAYAEQMDRHEWTSTVREAFRISAYLRQPADVSKENKDAYVEDIIELLELQDLADGMIGFPGYGLSVSDRKLVTIGVELAAKPDLLLFLDEPTSGLDSSSAFSITRFLKKLAGAGVSILCTIHQPNALIFQTFDRLLLLQRGGECVYFGPIGKDSHGLSSYLERNGAPVPADANPAEFMLEAIGAGSRRRMGGGDWGEKWRNSPEFEEVKREIAELKQSGLDRVNDESKPKTEYATSFMFQFKTILARTNLALWRNADYQFTRLFSHIAIAMVVGLTFLQLNNSLQSLQYRVFVVFFATVLPAIILAQIEPQYIMSRMTFDREASSKMYSAIVFALSQLLAEMPYSVLNATVYFLLIQFMVFVNPSSDRSGYHFIFIVVVEIYAVSLGQALAALSPSIMIAALFNPFLLIIFSIFCGVTVPAPTMQYFWRVWMLPLDPFTRLINGIVTNQLEGVPVVCTPSEFNVFPAPSGVTCGDYAGAYATAVGGYLENPDSTGNCNFCQYSVGNSFYNGLSLSYDNRVRDLFIMVAYCIFNVLVLLAAAKWLRWGKR